MDKKEKTFKATVNNSSIAKTIVFVYVNDNETRRLVEKIRYELKAAIRSTIASKRRIYGPGPKKPLWKEIAYNTETCL